jgi:hypothetical protein
MMILLTEEEYKDLKDIEAQVAKRVYDEKEKVWNSVWGLANSTLSPRDTYGIGKCQFDSFREGIRKLCSK